MIKNYFIVAWRNLKKNRLTSFINISGLTISISICLLIALFIHDEISYDTFENGHKQVYRVEQLGLNNGVLQHWAASPGPLRSLLIGRFPEVETAARLFPSAFAYINVDEKKFKEENCFLADSSFFETMGLPFVQGNPHTALCEPNSVVLSEKMAKRLFGDVNVMHRTLLINSTSFKVTGILKDIPASSHLQLELVRPLALMKDQPIFSNWGANALYTYARLKKGADLSSLSGKISDLLVKENIIEKKTDITYRFHPLSRIHLDGNVEKELSQNSSWTFIYIFLTIGFLILLLASINYINLTTSRSLERSREIGVRKTLGAFRKHLIAQFITESVFLTLISYVIALAVVFIMLPAFNAVTGKHLSMLAIFNPFFVIVSLGIVVFIGVLAGLYPAFVISSFEPVNTLKGIVSTNMQSKLSFGLRKGLVVFQFMISAFLVISSLVVMRQIGYMFSKPLGYNKENIMVLPAYKLTDQMLITMRNELKANPSVLSVSATSAVPGKRVILGGVKIDDRENSSIRTLFVDEDYARTMGISIVKGRHFSSAILSDSAEGAILNEAAVKQFGIKEPIGAKVELDFARGLRTCRVVGVVKDFHQGSLHNAIEPMVLTLLPLYNSIVIRYKGDLEAVKKEAAKAWSHVFPDELFTYSLLDDDLKTLYRTESTLKELLIVFTLLAIMIASLGLFGLIFFANTLRRKEIGIRKVLGAGNGAIVYMLSKEYMVLITISLAISLPLSGWALRQWLNGFAYRIEIPMVTFVMGVLIMLLIAFIIVFMQGMRAALNDPVKNLKTE